MKSIRPHTILTFLLLAAFCAIPQPVHAQTQSIALVSPVSGSTLTNSTVTFQWTNRTGVTEAWLAIGTKQQGTDILKWTQVWPSTSKMVSNIPLNGGKVYFEFWYYTGTWSSLNAVFNTIDSTPTIQLTSPVTGATLSSSTVTFKWTNPGGISEAWIALGKSVGSNGTVKDDILKWTQVWPSTSKVVTNIPMSGSPVYFEFWYKSQGFWKSIKETFQTENQMGSLEIVSPFPGITLANSTQSFQWTNRTDVTEAWMAMGTKKSPDGVVIANVFNWQQVWPNLARTVTGIPMDGNEIYFEFWYKASEQWMQITSTYLTENQQPSPIYLLSPEPGTTLNLNPVTFKWSNRSDVSEAWLAVGTGVGSSNVVGWTQVWPNLEYTANSLPLTGNPVYFDLWYKTLDNQWTDLSAAYFTEKIITCGNGIIDPGEQCEAGTKNCTATRGYSGTQSCLANCTYSACQTTEFCGDGIKNGGENCDNGTQNGQAGKCNSTCTAITGSGQTPYSGAPVNGVPTNLPGKIEVEHFDEGGPGVAYMDTDIGNSFPGVTFRGATDVDIKELGNGNYAIGRMPTGEWLKYTVKVTQSGTYKLRMRVSSDYTDGQVAVYFGSTEVTAGNRINVYTHCWMGNPDTCGQIVERTVQLPAGQQVMKIESFQDGTDIDWIEVVSGSSNAVCGNGVVESGEYCDHGSSNGQAGKCNTSCTGLVPNNGGSGQLPGSRKGYKGLPLLGVHAYWDQFAAMLGRQLEFIKVNFSSSNWSEAYKMPAALKSKEGAGAKQALINFWPTTMTPDFAGIAKGTYDTQIRQFAQNMAAQGFQDLLIVPWHEFNGSWYAYALQKTSPAQFKAAWEHAYSVIKPIVGNNVKLGLCINLPSFGVSDDQAKAAVPGPGYLDAIGFDFYAGGQFGLSGRYPSTQMQETAFYNMKSVWLDWITNVARQRNIMLFIGEWGSIRRSPSNASYDGCWECPRLNELLIRYVIDNDFAQIVNFNTTYTDGDSRIDNWPGATQDVIKKYLGVNPAYLPYK